MMNKDDIHSILIKLISENYLEIKKINYFDGQSSISIENINFNIYLIVLIINDNF